MRQRTRAAALALILCLCTPALAAAADPEDYSDVPAGAWYSGAVQYCRIHGLMDGTGGGEFSPDAPMTRAMLAEALYRQAGSPAAAAPAFPDVPEGERYARAVGWAAEYGVMVGGPDGSFRPQSPITREELATAFWRRAGSPSVQAADYDDEGAIADWARDAVDWARSTGLMVGDGAGRFSPKGRATRAQAAQVLANYGDLPREAIGLSAMDVMCQPCGLAVMEDGALLVTDLYYRAVWRVSGGKSERYAGADTPVDLYGQPIGGYHDSTLGDSVFKSPWAAAPFLKGWAVSDPENGVVRFLRPAGGGNKTRVTDLGVKFDHPTGLAADGAGNLYVAETFQGKILKITPRGTVTTLRSGLEEPMGLCWADGGLYVAESGRNRVVRLDGGTLTVVAGSGEQGCEDGPADAATFSAPKGVAVDGDGAVYVADTDSGAVRLVRNGEVSTVLSRDPWDTTALYPVAPTGLLIQGDTLYIGDVFARKLLAMPLR